MLPHFPLVNDKFGLPSVAWPKEFNPLESYPFIYWLFWRPIRISTRALAAACALSSSKIMQLHSGSGFLMEDFALELELVEFVPVE